MNKAKRRRAFGAYCGEPWTSDDHIPPLNLFPTDRTNLITVPSCQEHNGSQSGVDEQFRNYIVAKSGGDTPETLALIEKAIRSVRRQKKPMTWRADLSALEVKIESSAFKPVVERITRGLYWDRYRGERLPPEIEMQIAELRISEWLPRFVSDMNRFRVAKDQFLCAYNRMDDHPTISAWVYVFHRRVVAMAFTDIRHPLSVAAAAEASDEAPKPSLGTMGA